MADTVYVTGRGSDKVYHQPAKEMPGAAPRTSCGLVVGGVTPMMSRDLAAQTARACPTCYWIPDASVGDRAGGGAAVAHGLSGAPPRNSVAAEPGSRMTEQYLVGQFSSLLSDLEPAPSEWRTAVNDLRREVERSQSRELPRLVRDALGLADAICLAALEHGDAPGFRRYAAAAAALVEFAENAGLISR
ncbi:MAG TPA: hypothetical protein VE777_06705 [Gaiellales bacterium]|nr:hypothetical protein [Gaiellales bacterium]